MATEPQYFSLASNLGYLPQGQGDVLQAEMVKHLRIKGQIASSARIESSLSQALMDNAVSADTLQSIIIDDALLSLRFIGLANSAAYRREQATQNVSSAVSIVGINKVSNIISDISETKNYATYFRGRSIACSLYHEMILSMLIAARLIRVQAHKLRNQEMILHKASLASYLYNSALFALAFARPNIYSACLIEGLSDTKAGFEPQFHKVFNLSRLEVAISLAEQLGMPGEFTRILRVCEVLSWKKSQGSERESKDFISIASAVYFGSRLARELLSYSGTANFEAIVKEAQNKLEISKSTIWAQICGLPLDYLRACEKLGLSLMRLPPFLFADDIEQGAESDSPIKIPEKLRAGTVADRMDIYLQELKACLRTRATANEFVRMPQAIVSTLFGLVYGVGFSRACVFRYDKERSYMMPLYLFGETSETFRYLLRSGGTGNDENMPDLQACLKRKTVFHGDSIFKDAWPFVAFPIVWQGEVQGVFYADKGVNKNAASLDVAEQVACIALAENWGEVPDDFK